MTVCRTVKKGVFIDTNIDCQNCDSVKRICTWDGECENLEPMTNEEWLKSRSNKELANAIFSAFVESATMIGCCVTLEYFRTQMELIDALREWLKQPHSEVEK